MSLPCTCPCAEVSPPPPPPLVAGAYDDMVADDPEGFSDVRNRLEDWFPKLSHVATSSSGATIGEYIADLTVTPQQLTRAFLASSGMVADSLGARVVESKHTGTGIAIEPSLAHYARFLAS